MLWPSALTVRSVSLLRSRFKSKIIFSASSRRCRTRCVARRQIKEMIPESSAKNTANETSSGHHDLYNRWRMLYRRKVAASLTGDFLYWACHTTTSCTPAWNHAHSSSARKDASRPGCSVLRLQNRYGPLTGDCVLAAPPVGTTRAANNQGSFYRGRFPGDFLVVSKSNVRQ